ncbi:MAG: DnaJ domain-containing protein [Clostridia bacterium]
MDYYELLEISPNASIEVAEKAYKALVKKYHPDLYTGLAKEKAEEKIKQINKAYEVIKDVEKRKEYDDKRLEKEAETHVDLSNDELLRRLNEYEVLLKKYTEYIDKMSTVLQSSYEQPVYEQKTVKEQIKELSKEQKKAYYVRVLKFYLKKAGIFLLKCFACALVILTLLNLPPIKNLVNELFSIVDKFKT